MIYVNSRAEKKVATRLQQEGIESYVPLKKELKQWSDRKKTIETPMISGYVFVKPDALQRDKVLQFQGVLQYVRYNSGDAIIRDIEIEALKSIESKGYFVEGKFSQNLNAGDKVIIQHGLFKGMYGEVMRLTDKDLFKLQLEGIGYSLTVEVPYEIVERK